MKLRASAYRVPSGKGEASVIIIKTCVNIHKLSAVHVQRLDGRVVGAAVKHPVPPGAGARVVVEGRDGAGVRLEYLHAGAVGVPGNKEANLAVLVWRGCGCGGDGDGENIKRKREQELEQESEREREQEQDRERER